MHGIVVDILILANLLGDEWDADSDLLQNFMKPWAGIEPTPSFQEGQVGRGDFPAPGFALKSKNPGAGTISAMLAAAGPVLGPKSYA
ncbi:hypothetical protein DSO57_1000566 [Entomophthora muscae]|uniref:Uncharacterized protein n=1 Tax=Entomophthora muscae TaxID=34485 RepID=A0ACC2SBF7_9FUNG|nr:hypothetical protein DSO57_1000566 [Entomophthora muscae]